MSDCLRVRLTFKNFSNVDLKNSLLSFRKNETKDIKSLKKLIEKRFKLKQKFELKIDDFVLESKETIDIVRDNDLIEIEAESDFSAVRVKPEPKVKSEPKVKTEFNVKTEPKVKSESSSTSVSQTYSTYFSDKLKEIDKLRTDNEIKPSLEFENKKCKIRDITPVHKNDAQVKKRQNSGQHSRSLGQTPIKPAEKIRNLQKTVSKSKPETETTNKSLAEFKQPMTPMRGIPIRKAFQSATLKFSPQFKAGISGPETEPEVTNKASTSETPKPKRKRTTREACEPVDRFSPIIVLNRYCIPDKDSKEDSNQSNGQQKRVAKRTQSARKSFAIPERKKPIKSDDNSNNKTEVIQIEKQKDGIDFDNCEPLPTIPNIGDIIAFKILTLSSDGIGLECSHFKMASVLNVNKDTQMVDVLLKDVLKRNNSNDMNKSEQISGIHSLKINWSTVFEPKLIQSNSEPDLIIL